MKTQPFASRARSGIVLIAFCAVVLAVPAFIGRALPEANPFDPAPREALKSKSPDYVFIGNSMVDTRIDVTTLEDLTKGRVALLWDGGAASARWYLYLKNYVIPSGVKPRRVFLFFRDWGLSLPQNRLTGEYREGNERAMRPDDLLVRRFMDQKDGQGNVGMFSKILTAVYPIQRRGMSAREAITEKLVKMISSGKDDREKVFDDLEDTFALKNLRHDLAVDLPGFEDEDEDEDEPLFSSDPNVSFLPHIVDVAKQAEVPLVLIRVKRRPETDGITSESTKLRKYVEALREYLNMREVPFYDETSDGDIPETWYADGDHIAAEYRAEYTKHFYRELKRFFE